MIITATKPKPFTGYHMTAILIAFFGVIIAVNFAMAKLALSSFSGTLVKNSYVASQNYNAWLAQADKEAHLGWSIRAIKGTQNRIEVRLQDKGAPAQNMTVSAIAEHPLGRATSIELGFISKGDGIYIATRPLPDGRWKLRIITTRGSDTAHYVVDIS